MAQGVARDEQSVDVESRHVGRHEVPVRPVGPERTARDVVTPLKILGQVVRERFLPFTQVVAGRARPARPLARAAAAV